MVGTSPRVQTIILDTDHLCRDVDVQKYKSQTEVIKSMLSKYKKMELRLETYEKTHTDMEEHARYEFRGTSVFNHSCTFSGHRVAKFRHSKRSWLS